MCRQDAKQIVLSSGHLHSQTSGLFCDHTRDDNAALHDGVSFKENKKKRKNLFLIVLIIFDFPWCLLVILLCSYQQLKYQIDPEYLFSPINGEGKAERALVEQYFKVNYTHRFNVGRITRPGKLEQK